MVNNHPTPKISLPDPRCGFHYFPDTLHYREADLRTWLPELQSLGAAWLVLRSEFDRAIPEMFLRGIKQAGIQPIIQFQLPLKGLSLMKEVGMLFDVYARWGARYAILFDRPNIRSAWPVAGWVQQDLVERFLDRYLPLANRALSAGMVPIFPPLEPGGNYWDTAFLRSALEVMQRRKQEQMLQSLVLSAYGWTSGHSLNWGIGGPEAWPQARPYQVSQNGQNQCGFRIFDWYQSVAKSILNQNIPIILLQAGLPGHPATLPENILTSSQYIEDCKNITRLIAGEATPDPLSPETMLSPISSQVIACNFWHLGDKSMDLSLVGSQNIDEDQKNNLCKWFQDRQRQRLANLQEQEAIDQRAHHTIRHYLLLPGAEWGISDWYLEIIRPFVKKHLPTVGFSSIEAERADLVTVVGNIHNYPDDMLIRLKKAGCKIDQINGDGTKIASELAER